MRLYVGFMLLFVHIRTPSVLLGHMNLMLIDNSSSYILPSSYSTVFKQNCSGTRNCQNQNSVLQTRIQCPAI
jgi:hypothetical protein